MCRNIHQNSITSCEHAFTKMDRAKIVQTQISAFALTIDSGAWCKHAIVPPRELCGGGRTQRPPLARPPFHWHRHHTTPPESPFYSSVAHSVSCFSISSGCGTRARARAYLLLTDTRAHIRTRSHVHTYYTQLLRTNNFLTRVLCYICVYI